MSCTYPMNNEGCPIPFDFDEHPDDCVCDMCTRC